MLVYFWLKVLHITAMTIWFTGLFFLPRLLVERTRRTRPEEAQHIDKMTRTIYLRVMTPAGLLMIGLGLALIGFGFEGVWLPVKLVLVSTLVMLHLFYGRLLLEIDAQLTRGRPVLLGLLGWLPLAFVLAIAALTAAKPLTLPLLS